MGQDFTRFQVGWIVGLVGAQVTDLLLQTRQPFLQLQQPQGEGFAHLAEGLELLADPLLQRGGRRS